ncbi:DUF3494 domain-containing protein [Actinacidiphila oryziradicis]|uniref:DUF3494 domain-containing protein n=1 Tax=Actinacidiphila oryziradicis TaxID=2571141 RepID=A0A4U0S0F7_9ACTN|nr:DUF3494 domain-containing protein [Actinacidiphila oryziradicis]
MLHIRLLACGNAETLGCCEWVRCGRRRSIGLTGTLTLDAQGNRNAEWIFQIGSTLTTATASRVLLTGGATARNVIWQIGSPATLGTDTAFVGRILAAISITVNAGVTVNGQTLARDGSVTLATNTIARAW